MKKALIYLMVGAVVVGCSPATPTRAPIQDPAPMQTAIPASVTPVTSNPPALEPSPTASLTSAPTAATPLPIATSRGPDLEATDPATVVLASGGLQLVEFFAFW